MVPSVEHLLDMSPICSNCADYLPSHLQPHGIPLATAWNRRKTFDVFLISFSAV